MGSSSSEGCSSGCGINSSPPVGCSSKMPSHDAEVASAVGEATAVVCFTCSATCSRSTSNSSMSISGCSSSASSSCSEGLSISIRSEITLARRNFTPPASNGGMKLTSTSTTSVDAITSQPRRAKSFSLLVISARYHCNIVKHGGDSTQCRHKVGACCPAERLFSLLNLNALQCAA